MIDREARDTTAEALRHFVSGQITNFDFEERFPVLKDPVIFAIRSSIWLYHCDLKEHKMTGNWELPNEMKEHIHRWIMFLHSNEEYQWPRFCYPGIRPSIRHGWISRLFKGPEKEQKFMSSGNYDVWPFIDSDSFEAARQNPSLLSGSN